MPRPKRRIRAIIAETGASAMKDMGRVMALVKERLAPASNPPAPVRWCGACSPKGVSLSPAFLDELRARTLLSGIIAPSVKLQGRAGVEGVLPVPPREDAELHDQRRQGLLPLLRLRGARRRDPLPDRPARPAVHGCGKGARGEGGDGGSRPRSARAGAAERATGLTDVMAAVAQWFAEQLTGRGTAPRRATI